MTSTNGLRKGTKREFEGSKSPLVRSLRTPATQVKGGIDPGGVVNLSRAAALVICN